MGFQQSHAGHHGRIDGGEVVRGLFSSMNMATPWICLIVAGCFEVVWALGIKYTEGFTKPVASTITIGAMAASVWLLAIAIKTIPVGTGYAVWVGIGAVGAAIGGMILFGESKSVARIVCILLIVGGVIGLKLFSDIEVARG